MVQNECIKNTKNLTEKFVQEIKQVRDSNKNNKDFGKSMKNFTKNLYNKYINDFMNNDLIDDENKKEFVEKLKNKLNHEMNVFEKENEKIFEENFENMLNELSEQFIKELIDKEKNNKYFDFFFEFDNFRQKANQLTPDFPHKSDIIYDKIIEILRKYVEENISKKKKNNDEIIQLKKENEQQKNILNDLREQINNNKKQNIDEENKLKKNISDMKNKNKEIEKKIDDIILNKKKDEEKYKADIINTKNKYEIKIKEIINNQNNQNSEINLKNEQLNLMKLNNEKLMKLHQKKFDYYENEVKKLREKYDKILKETEISEKNLNANKNNLLNMNNKIKKLNNNSDRNRNENEKYKNEVLTNDLNDFMDYIQDNLTKQNEQNKSMMDKIIKNKEKDCINDKELYDNFKNIKKRNEELETQININENKIKLLKNQINNLKQSENIFQNQSNNKIICNNCNKLFYHKDFKEHNEYCQNNYLNNINNYSSKDYLNENSYNNRSNFDIYFDPNKLRIKIIKGQIKTDELNKPYLDYLINVNYDKIKNWQVHKKFYHFSNLYNAINNSYRDYIQLPNSLSNIFNDLNSKSSFNLNKIQQLEKFINEVAQTEVINTSKPFLKFIEFEKNFNKNEKNKNSSTSYNILSSKQRINNYNNKYNNLIESDYNNEDNFYYPGKSSSNNRYINDNYFSKDYNNIYNNINNSKNIGKKMFDNESDSNNFENNKENEYEEDEEGAIKSSFMKDIDNI